MCIRDSVYGSTCARVKAALSVGKLLGYWNIPYLSFSSIDPQLADKKTHNTLIRMMSPFNHMASALGQICANFSVRLSLSMFSSVCVCVCVCVCRCACVRASSKYTRCKYTCMS